MLTVETFLKETNKKGIGLFAAEPILAGEAYWKRNELFDKIITIQQMENYGKLEQFFIKHYGFLEKAGNWYLCVDNARFCNHSDNANTLNHIDKFGKLTHCTAITNIERGEEILCNYRDICAISVKNLGFIDTE